MTRTEQPALEATPAQAWSGTREAADGTATDADRPPCNRWLTDTHMCRDITLLVLALAAALLLAGPNGEFPLMDDWSFAAAVKTLLDEGRFAPTEWTAMTLLSQVLWGAAFALVNGFSFETLRFSTIVLALVGAGAGYALMRETGQSRWLSLLLGWTLAFTPLYFVLSFTFMTDVPFIAVLLFAAIAYCRNLQTGSRAAWIAAIALSLIAILSRQLAMALPVGFAIACLFRDARPRQWAKAMIPPLLGIGCFVAFHQWMTRSGTLPAATDEQATWLLQSLLRPETVSVFFRNSYVALVYLGWFLLPLTWVIARRWPRAQARSLRKTVVGSGLAIALLSLLSRTRNGSQSVMMPTADNLLVPSGLGPTLLRDQYLLRLDNIPPLPDLLWMTVTALGLLGATLLLALLWAGTAGLLRRRCAGGLDAADAIAAFLLSASAVYLFPLLVTAFFDRYLLPVLPLLAVGLACACRADHTPIPTTRQHLLPAIMVAAFAVFSIVGSHDYMAWNRLRWQVLDQLMQQHQLTPDDIDGGFEFNGYHRYDPAYVAVPGKSNWWVTRDDWMIAYGPLAGFDIVEQHTYSSWLWLRPQPLFVLKKKTAPPGNP